MPFGMTLIDGPVPNIDDLEWDSPDIASDSIPMIERHDKPDILWWSILIEENVTEERYDEMFRWCKENAAYQCGMRYNEGWNDILIVGFFRHPDDAMAFKLAWS